MGSIRKVLWGVSQIVGIETVSFSPLTMANNAGRIIPLNKVLTDLSAFLEKLAWEDVGLHPLAEYFILADMLGSGQGQGKVWPLSVLSSELWAKLKKGGYLVSGERWHEWSIHL